MLQRLLYNPRPTRGVPSYGRMPSRLQCGVAECGPTHGITDTATGRVVAAVAGRTRVGRIQRKIQRINSKLRKIMQPQSISLFKYKFKFK